MTTKDQIRDTDNFFCNCENMEQAAGLLSAINFTERHPDYALYVLKEILSYPLLQSALDAEDTQPTVLDARGVIEKVEHLHKLIAYGIDHAIQVNQRQTIIERLVCLCERIIPLFDELKSVLTQPTTTEAG